MFSLYVASLIFGGILIGFSLFFGGDHDSDLDVHTDVDLDVDAHIDIDTDEIPHDIAHTDTDIDSHSGSMISDALQFFSLRNMTYFATFFGLTGTLFTLFSFSHVITLISSLSLGTFAWFFSYFLIKYLKSTSSGETFNITDLKGQTGKISLETSKQKKGKVIIEYRGSNYELPAIISENSEFDKFVFNEKILVIDFQEGIAVIEKFDL